MPNWTLNNFDFTFKPKINRSLVFDLATSPFINEREDPLFVGPGGHRRGGSAGDSPVRR